MALIIHDDFSTLAAGVNVEGRSPSPVNTVGATWTNALTARGATGGGKLDLYATSGHCFVNTGTPNQRVSGVRNSGSHDHQILCRLNVASLGGGANGYALLCRPSSNTARISKYTGGSRSDLKSFTVSGLTGDHTWEIRVETVGSDVVLEFFLDGVSQGTYTDLAANSPYLTGNYAGLYAEAGAGTWDDFKVDNLVSTPGGPVSGSGTLQAQSAQVVGQGGRVWIDTGAGGDNLRAGSAIVVGIGSVIPNQPPDPSDLTGIGAIVAGPAVVAGLGMVRSTITGSGALKAGAARVRGYDVLAIGDGAIFPPVFAPLSGPLAPSRRNRPDRSRRR